MAVIFDPTLLLSYFLAFVYLVLPGIVRVNRA